MTDPRELLDRLDALRADATPGPWFGHDFGHSGVTEPECIVIQGGPFDWDGASQGNFVVATPAWDAHGARDVDLIVEAVNALPALTAALRAVLNLHGGGLNFCAECGERRPCTTEEILIETLIDALGDAW